MRTKKPVAIAALVGDQIFCCGDRLGDLIEYCELVTGRWKYAPASNLKLALDQLVSHNGQLFIVRKGSIEKYEPDTRTYLVVSLSHSI